MNQQEVMMSVKEAQRLAIIKKVEAGTLRQADAAQR
jgi:hypothetical protein